MLTLIAAVLFALGLILELLGINRLTTPLLFGGLLCLALAGGLPWIQARRG
jgi:hypothetical protein